jgi:hypothetical protein
MCDEKCKNKDGEYKRGNLQRGQYKKFSSMKNKFIATTISILLTFIDNSKINSSVEYRRKEEQTVNDSICHLPMSKKKFLL